MSIKVKYISFGKYETGGYKHELFFAQQFAQFLTTEHEKCELIIERSNRFFENPFAYLKLFLIGLKANGNYNIVVARVAVFAMLRNLFTKNKVYIVLHNFDEDDGKSIWLKWYYHLLFFLLKNLPIKNVSIVAVAPFWVSYFKNKINNNVLVYLFPNFFDGNYYEKFVQNQSHFEHSPIVIGLELSHSVSTTQNITNPLSQLTKVIQGFVIDLQDFSANFHNITIDLKDSANTDQYSFKIKEQLSIIFELLPDIVENSTKMDEFFFEIDKRMLRIEEDLFDMDEYLSTSIESKSAEVFHWSYTVLNFFEGAKQSFKICKDLAKSFPNSKIDLSCFTILKDISETNSPQLIEDIIKKQIHLGQWSFKNHLDVFEVAKKLTAKGYYCYFSTNFKDFEKKTNDYEVVYFEQFEDYLVQMAMSEFTLALTAINEGWNRVAHESIFVGTPVIAYAKAGLLDLVNESKSYAAVSVADVLQAIENKNIQAEPSLLAHYDIRNCQKYIRHFLVNL